MKHLLRKTLLTLPLALVLAAVLLCPTALADTVLGGNAGQTGEYYVKTLVRYADYTVKLTEIVGTVPAGIEFSDGDALVAFGTPTEPGSFACTLHFRMDGRDPATPSKDGSFEFAMTVTGEAAAVPSPVATPAAAASPTPVVANAKLPVIYKSPTDETVDVGKQAEFVARFDNAIWAVWHFVSPDGKEDIAYYDLDKSTFPGMKILNGNYSHLILKNIPYELNGWRVYCLYTNNDGSTPTEMALITVNPPPATPTPVPTPTPTPTPVPTPTPTPLPTEAPDGESGQSGQETAALPSAPPEGGDEGTGVSTVATAPEARAKTADASKESKGVSKLAIAAGVAVLLLGAGCGAWFFLSRPVEEPIQKGKHSK